jgi:uncharacterized protein (DUF2147 family)
MRIGIILAAGLMAVFGLLPSTSRAADPSGDWLVEAGDTKVRVSRCGAALCGEIVWLKEGQSQRDEKNADPSKQQRSLIGLRIFEMQQKGEAWTGPVYNSDDGNTYEGTLSPQADAAKLEMKACMGDQCGAELWTREP